VQVVFAETHLRGGTRQEQNLRASANIFISCFEGLAEAVKDGGEEDGDPELAERFGAVLFSPSPSSTTFFHQSPPRKHHAVLMAREILRLRQGSCAGRVWADYQTRFTAWKRSSASFLTDELVAAYLEIEAAKISADGGSGGIETTLASIPGLADDREDDILEENRAALEDGGMGQGETDRGVRGLT
jgi:hypothetical protein